MDASLFYTPVEPKQILDGATSNVRAALNEVFGGWPITLTSEHVDQLLAMAAASGCTVYTDLSEAVGLYGSIIIEAEY